MVSFFAPWNTTRFSGWEQGIPNKPIGLDNLNLFYPYKQLSIDLIKQGMLPLWNPYNFTGNVLMANFQSAIFYPLNIIYFLFPMIDAWSIMVAIQPLLAGVFTYLFLSCFPIRKKGAIFGALTFAFSGEMIVWMGDHLTVSHTMLWLPLILFSLEKFWASGKIRFWSIGVIALVSALFGGFVQPLVYVFGTSVCYAGFRLLTDRRLRNSKIIGLTVFLFILAIGVSSIQLIPTWEIFRESPRFGGDVGYLFDQYLMPFSHLISFLAPDYLGNPATYNFLGVGGYHESVLFVGIVSFGMAILSWQRVRTRPAVLFFWIVALGSIVLGLNIPPVRWLYRLQIPVFSTFVPSRIFFLTSFALSILSAFGLELFLSGKQTKQTLKIIAVFGIALLVWLAMLMVRRHHIAPDHWSIMLRNLAIPAITVVLFGGAVGIGHFFKKARLIALFLILLGGGLYFAHKYLSFSDRQFVYPAHPVFEFFQKHAGNNRFWTYGDGYIYANFATQYHVYSADGTDALVPRRLSELFYTTETGGKLTADTPRIDARIARAQEGESMTDNPYRLRLLSLAGVKYITDWTKNEESEEVREKKFPPSLFGEVWNKDGWHIYEYTQSLPRVFLTGAYSVESKDQKILNALFREPIDGKKLVLEQQPTLPIDKNGAGTAEIISYDPLRVRVAVKSPANALLFLSDTYFVGWLAFVDGRQTPIYRANYAFRAVPVPVGAQTVEFRYAPGSFYLGLFISGISLAAWLFIGMISLLI